MIKDQPRDIENVTVGNSVGGILPVQNFTVVSGEWTPIITNTDIKEFLLQPRQKYTWFFATASGAATYFTFRDGAAWETRLVVDTSATIGWVSSDYSITMEFLAGR